MMWLPHHTNRTNFFLKPTNQETNQSKFPTRTRRFSLTTLRYEDHNIKVYENEKRILEKSNELDTIKIIQKFIETYNQNKNFHYFLRLKFGVRRAWF